VTGREIGWGGALVEAAVGRVWMGIRDLVGVEAVGL